MKIKGGKIRHLPRILPKTINFSNFSHFHVTFCRSALSYIVKANDIRAKGIILGGEAAMDDSKILDLYFARDERAIKQTKSKYGSLLFRVSYGILRSAPDAEECVDDTYMSAWGCIPPERPKYFSAFLTKIVRNLSFNRYKQNKRRYSNMIADGIFEEIAECIPDSSGDAVEDMAIRDCLNRFLSGLSSQSRIIFVKRYFFMKSIDEIADEVGIKPSAVKVALSRARSLLRARLESEDIYL